jgi:ATP-dependent helicase/nuclease subunit A
VAKLAIPYNALPKLGGEQALASRPSERVWLKASAGTGKTQVLTARVLRLLLTGAAPETILCLTFTKAGASEMAERIHTRLGKWVLASDNELFTDLQNLGEPAGPEDRAHARTLFARVLDARGGGLRIQTIHSFCQSLLGSFPSEAGLIPGFRPIEGRAESALAQSVLADLVDGAARTHRDDLISSLQSLALRLGEEGARGFLARCAAKPDAMAKLGLIPSEIEGKVRAWLHLGDIDPEEVLLAACTDGGFDRAGIEAIRRLNLEWDTKTAMKRVEAITDWLAMGAGARLAHLDILTSVWTTANGEMRSLSKGQAPQDPGYGPLLSEQYATFNSLLELRALAATAAAIGKALIIGQAYSDAYAAAKRNAGVVDFNDMIRHTVSLLTQSGMGEWIRLKLDQSTDHILIDEAQDTNEAQWDIVKALTGEFFAGDGAKPNVGRTIFTVGDYKQAIFGFQGTNPEEFSKAQDFFNEQAAQLDEEILDLSLARSFRSGQAILTLVDAVIAEVTPEAMGIAAAVPAHISANKGSGSVTLWPPVAIFGDADDMDVEEDWLDDSVLAFADNLATQIKAWTSGGLTLRNHGGRNARAGDVLILLQKRGELARLIVSRLHEAGVAVAGVDRLRLNAPIAVLDLLACIRFALQPEDDLTLAALLVSPLVGWTQDDLYARAKGRSGALWPHLRQSLDKEELAVPFALLGMADLSTPYRFLETTLSGAIGGRRKLLSRLGEEARDPIEELLSAALAFERDAPPSLQLFLDWFDRGDVEIKRDPSKPGDGVRVMTVHGAKGLQAPIVVLADATSDPANKMRRDLDWQAAPGVTLPIFRPRAADRVASLKTSAEESDAREREEYWRLLYVALTRAEEHLFIGGALSKRQAKGMSEDCWHMRIGAALRGLGPSVRAEPVEASGSAAMSFDELRTNGVTVYAVQTKIIGTGDGGYANPAPDVPLPAWLLSPAPEEARPPRPLAPSAIEGGDDEASPPPTPEMRKAARRGQLIHALLQRLPDVAPDAREAAAERWLAHSAGVDDVEERAELIAAVQGVLTTPEFAALFAEDALAEAPLAGIVGERVIAGTVDRLLVSADDVLVIDYKTGRRVPSGIGAVPEAHKAQMAAYVAVLRGIFPDKAVRAALLYTSGPRLIVLGDDVIEAHKPGYREAQQKLAAGG